MMRLLYFCLLFLIFGCQTVKKESEVENIQENNKVRSVNFEKIESKILLDIALSPKEYSRWVNDEKNNPLIKRKKLGDINYELKYTPIAQMINNDLREEVISRAVFDSLYEEYSGMEYYELKLSVDNFNEEVIKYQITDYGAYQSRINYVSFGMQEDIKLTYAGGEVDCGLYHFERTYGVAPHLKILLGFSKEKMNSEIEERTIEFEDNLFNKGLIKYNWNSASLNNIPKIKVS